MNAEKIWKVRRVVWIVMLVLGIADYCQAGYFLATRGEIVFPPIFGTFGIIYAFIHIRYYWDGM
jgi:hypothetical protein